MNPANLSLGDVPDAMVSVIIPAYNAAPYLKETLDSVFAQTYPHYEVIIVNDGSPDTLAIEQVLLPYADRVVYIKQENRGPSSARNTGLRAAKGDLVACLDADDIWNADHLQEQTRFLKENPEYDLVYANARFFGDSIYDGKEYMDVCPSNGDASSLALISRRCHVYTSSVLARREKLTSVGFDESLRASEDFDCWMRFSAAGHRIGYQRSVLVNYRKHDSSASADQLWMVENNIKVLTKSLALWPEGSEEGQALLQAKNKKVAELERTKGKIALRKRDISNALIHLQTANIHDKNSKTSAVIWFMKILSGLVTYVYK